MPASRRHFLGAGLGSAAGIAFPFRTAAAEDSFDLTEMGIAELQAAMKAGTETAKSLVEKYLARIEKVDRAGPKLRSVIEANPDAAKIAESLDAERKTKGPRGPLHGIPILVKDNIATADGMETTAGSLAMVGSKPREDAWLVHLLRKAGAVVLGKTNLSEWANARGSNSTSGWSGRGGLTKNPYALDRNPCGSSSGSAAAAAASLCAAAIGTETDGSITAPASVCGIVGVKPTVGLVSRSGVIPISHSQDTAGPMTRSVRDAAVVLGAITAVDPGDAVTAEGVGKRFDDYTQFLVADGLKGARLGVARNHFGFHEAVDRLMEPTLDALKRLGSELIDTTELPKAEQFSAAELIVFQYEMKAGVDKYLASLERAAPMKSLRDVIAFNEKNRDRELRHFGQDFLQKAESKGTLRSDEYLEALAKCRRIARTDGIDAVMDKLKLDAIVAPTMGPASITDLLVGDRWVGGDTISVAAVAGYPHITVPAGFVSGLPVGLSFIGRAWSEPVLFKLAHSFEQSVKARKPPRFLPTIDVQ